MTNSMKRASATGILMAATLVVLAVLATGTVQAGDEKKKSKKNSRVQLVVVLTAEGNGEPIRNASVYVKFKKKRRLRRDRGREYAGKSDPEGRAVFPRIPEGQALIQVVAEGWRTYGKFHELEGGKILLEITLERPPRLVR